MNKRLLETLKNSVLTKEELIKKAKEYLMELEKLPNDVLFAEYQSSSEYLDEYYSKPSFPEFKKFVPYSETLKYNGKLVFVHEV